jgi:hypothetical protein
VSLFAVPALHLINIHISCLVSLNLHLRLPCTCTMPGWQQSWQQQLSPICSEYSRSRCCLLQVSDPTMSSIFTTASCQPGTHMTTSRCSQVSIADERKTHYQCIALWCFCDMLAAIALPANEPAPPHSAAQRCECFVLE